VDRIGQRLERAGQAPGASFDAQVAGDAVRRIREALNSTVDGFFAKIAVGWQNIFDVITRQGGRIPQAVLDQARVNERNLRDMRETGLTTQNRGQFNTFIEGLRMQARTAGMTADEAERYRWAANGANAATLAQIDHWQRIRRNIEAGREAQRQMQRDSEMFEQRRVQLREQGTGSVDRFMRELRQQDLIDYNSPERARLAGQSFQRILGNLAPVQLPPALERGSADAVAAINLAASSRGDTVADAIAVLEQMLESDREQERIGRALLTAWQNNPRLRDLLSRSPS
jgi:hypothetical protein